MLVLSTAEARAMPFSAVHASAPKVSALEKVTCWPHHYCPSIQAQDHMRPLRLLVQPLWPLPNLAESLGSALVILNFN
jgi:hypothetical protein